MKKHIFAVHEKMKDNNCSCKEKDKCPLKNECEVESNGIVYEAEVTSFSNENEPVKVRKYIGGTSLKFKRRFYVLGIVYFGTSDSFLYILTCNVNKEKK